MKKIIEQGIFWLLQRFFGLSNRFTDVVDFDNFPWYNKRDLWLVHGKVVSLLKRILAIILCIALFAAVLPGQAFAEETELTKEEAVIKEAKRVYYYSLSSAGRESFQGWCGLMTSHQLYHMGINKSIIVNDGNKQFDYYKDLTVTDNGYYISAYPAEEYSLEEALRAISRDGTRDVYNILVGFDWTSTDAGARYGHACVINAILDGTVYFVESFYTSLAGPEGSVIQCSISEFAAYFSEWMIVDGVIYFGTGSYADACTSLDCDAFVQTRFESVLRSEPCLVGENECGVLRSITPGEVLHATGVYKNPQGDLFYAIDDGGMKGYVAANAVCVQQLNTADLTAQLSAESVRQAICLSGSVSAENGRVRTVDITVTDSSGAVVTKSEIAADACVYSLDLSTDELDPGGYTVTVNADAASIIVQSGVCKTMTRSVTLWSQTVTVEGQVKTAIEDMAAVSHPADFPVLDGWMWKNGSWYCYDEGKTCTGWTNRDGVKCYLDENGRAVTGWMEVDGKQLYFSGSGTLCTGWLATDAGMTWRDSDGVAATGLQTIGTRQYWFDQEGLLTTDGSITVDEVVYEIQSDGRAVPVTE